jgi:hypothetical protein
VLAIVAAAGLFVIGVGVIAWVTIGRDDGPDHPDEWDPRIADIAAFVEGQRRIDFEHPVFVDFLPDEEFRADVTTAEDELTDDDRESLEEAAALLRALGLAEGDVDLFESQNTLSGEGVAAYYDPERERIIVRGTELTPDIRVTLAHELTHALQDQFVDLDKVEEELEENQSDLLRAVVEGDASNVGDAYAEEELTPAERTEYERQSSDDAEGADLEDVPAALVAYFQAPYVFGPAFDKIVAERDGPVALNDVLRDPPSNDLQLLDPRAYFEHRVAEEVDVPDAPEGAEVIDDGDFGTLDWYIVVASRGDPKQAMAMIDNWAGDSYVGYTEGDRVCMKARYRAVDAGGSATVTDLLEDWIDVMGTDSATVSALDDRTIELAACDPGVEAKTDSSATVERLLVVPASRLIIAAELMDQLNIGFDKAWCVADGAVDALSPEDLAATELDPAAQQQVFDTMAACGVRPG